MSEITRYTTPKMMAPGSIGLAEQYRRPADYLRDRRHDDESRDAGELPVRYQLSVQDEAGDAQQQRRASKDITPHGVRSAAAGRIVTAQKAT